MSSLKAFVAAIVLLTTSAVSHAISISVTVTHHDICNYGGRIEVGVDGAVPPYQIFLNTGQEYTGWALEGLPAGVYQATVTDALLEQAVADFEVLAQSSFSESYIGVAYPSPNCGEGGRTIGLVYNGDGPYGTPGNNENSVPGYAPLAINAPFTPVSTTYPSCWTSSYLLEISGPPGTEQYISYTDANGCPGTIWAWVVQPSALPTLDLLDITGSCSNTSTGSVTVATNGGYLYDCAIRFYVYRMDGTLVNGTCTGFGYGSIETLPASQILRNLPAGNLTLRVQLQHFQGGGNWNEVPWPILPTCYADYPLTIPDNGPCAVVTGTVFVDGNESCTIGGSESRVDNAIVEVSPGPYYATNLSSGTFSLALPVGGLHTINVQHPSLEAICTPLSFNATIGATSFRDVPTRSLVPLDVAVFLNSGAARPGFQLRYGMKVKNLTPPTASTTVTMEFDPTLAYVSADPAPMSVVGNVITWSTIVYGWQERSFTVDLQVPPDVGLIGTDLVTSTTVTTSSTDGNLANNTAVDFRTVTGSYDPNDKLARTSSGDETSWNIGVDEWVDYTIRFQNTGNDTAFHIIITDTLPTTLDPASVQTSGASHPYSWEVVGQGVLKFRLLNIMLPDSNVNEAASHGFVSFRIKPHQPVLPGTTIENTANIFFDFNPPVITEPSVLVAEFSTGVAERSMDVALFPNPATRTLTIRGVGQDKWIITAMDGRTMLTGNFNSVPPTLDISELGAGSYLLQLINDQRRTTIPFQKTP